MRNLSHNKGFSVVVRGVIIRHYIAVYNASGIILHQHYNEILDRKDVMGSNYFSPPTSY